MLRALHWVEIGSDLIQRGVLLLPIIGAVAWAPWYVANSNDKRRARLNIISHILGKIDYEPVPRKKIQLPKRQERGSYRELDYPFKFIPEKFRHSRRALTSRAPDGPASPPRGLRAPRVARLGFSPQCALRARALCGTVDPTMSSVGISRFIPSTLTA